MKAEKHRGRVNESSNSAEWQGVSCRDETGIFLTNPKDMNLPTPPWHVHPKLLQLLHFITRHWVWLQSYMEIGCSFASKLSCCFQRNSFFDPETKLFLRICFESPWDIESMAHPHCGSHRRQIWFASNGHQTFPWISDELCFFPC